MYNIAVCLVNAEAYTVQSQQSLYVLMSDTQNSWLLQACIEF
jgi:hypothetical protein